MKRIHLFVAAPLVVTCVLLLGPAPAAEPVASWAAFQNSGEMISPTERLPIEWSTDKNVAWQATIEGYGQSTPIIDGDQIYVTSVSGPEKNVFHLAAFALESGERRWQRDFENPSPKENTPMTSRAAPTPVADVDGCIAFFEGGVVVSVDRDGEIRWRRNLVDDYGKADARHGLASSLEQDAQRVYVWVERSEEPYILALDKRSGTNVWKVDGAGSTTWASPRLVPTDDGHHLVCSAKGKILGLDPETGTKRWEFTKIENNTTCTPIPAGPNRFLIGASDGRGAENAASGAAFNGMIEITRNGEQYQARYVWNAKKASSSFGSPIVAGGCAWIVNRAGVLYQLNQDTGERIAVKRTGAGSIWATPIVAGNRLFLFGRKGTTSVISLADGDEIAENRLWEEAGSSESAFGGGHVLYAAAAASPYLILRRGDAIFAVKQTD